MSHVESPRSRWISRLFVFGITLAIGSLAISKEWISGIIWQEPVVIEPGSVGGPPSDAVVLFNGTDMSQWADGDTWLVQDGYASPRKGNVRTKASFSDCQLHMEWAAPEQVSGSGQGRGNSGVFLGDQYEVQILDSYENQTYFDGQAAAIYKTAPPLVNACRKPGEWQAYDIIYAAPRFNEHGQLVKPGYLTVIHNGVLVQNHTELLGETLFDSPPVYHPHGAAPIRLQFHGNPVRFRNIWLRELKEPQPQRPE